MNIEAPSAIIWAILVDIGQYTQWNPFLHDVAGRVAPGAQIHFQIMLAGNISFPAQAQITRVVVSRELRWGGKLLWPWLLRAEHYHTLEPISAARTRVRHGETFSGLIPLLLGPLIRVWAQRKYDAVSIALRRRAESSTAQEV